MVGRCEREPAPVETGTAGRTSPPPRGLRRRLHGAPRRAEHRQPLGGDRGPRPAPRHRPLGGPAAARTVVDVTDQLGAQRLAQHPPVVLPGQPDHARAPAGLRGPHRGAGALHLAGGRGQQVLRGRRGQAQHGGDLLGGQPVPHRQLQRLALLRGGAGRLGPGQPGQFGAAPLALLGRRLHGRRLGDGHRAPPRPAVPGLVPPPSLLGQFPQTGPAGQRVEPGPPVPLGRPAAAPLGHGEDRADGTGRGVLVAEHREAVGVQPVQVRLALLWDGGVRAARGNAWSARTGVRRGGDGPVALLTVRRVRAGGAGGGLRPAAHHPCDRRGPRTTVPAALSTFNPFG